MPADSNALLNGSGNASSRARAKLWQYMHRHFSESPAANCEKIRRVVSTSTTHRIGQSPSAPDQPYRAITGSTTCDGCAESCTSRWCATTNVLSRSLFPPVPRLRSYFGNNADETVTLSL